MAKAVAGAVETKDIAATKPHNSKKDIALKAIKDVRDTQHTMQREQDNLLKQNKMFWESDKAADVTVDNIPAEVRTIMANNLIAIGAFNILVKNYNDRGAKDMPLGINMNKMAEIFTGINRLSDENIIKLATGKAVTCFDNSITRGVMPMLGAEGEFWGSSASTFYSAALTHIRAVITDLPFAETIDLTRSSHAYSYSLPPAFNVSGIPKNSFLSTNSSEGIDFTVIHSGYSWAGSYGSSNPYAPHDCGTFVGKTHLVSKLFPDATTSTADLVAAHRHHYNKAKPAEEREFIPLDWDKSPSSEIVKLFDIQKIDTDTPAASVIGSTYVLRRFNPNAPEKTTLGAGGHTAIIIGTNEKGEFITIGANRDMPKMEGIGLQPMPMKEKAGAPLEAYKQVYTLSPTELVYDQEEFTKYCSIPYEGISNLHAVVGYFDESIIKVAGAAEELD